MRRIDTVDGELRVLAVMRSTLLEHDGTTEAVDEITTQVDELLDERLTLLYHVELLGG